MRKYQQEYMKSSNLYEFLRLTKKKYPDAKEPTLRRRYYKLRKLLGESEGRYTPDQKEQPNALKMIEFNEMVRFEMNINREYLRKHGFSEFEVNWLEDNKYLDKEYKPIEVTAEAKETAPETDEEMSPRIYDVPEEKSIDIEIDLFPGAVFTMRMTDEQAEELIKIIQNKLNGRW